MSDNNLEALIPGGGMVAAAIGLLGWFVRNSKDERNEWKTLLKEEREQHAKDLSEAERIEGDLRRRLADAETAIAGYKDEAADAARDLRICQEELAAERSRSGWMRSQLQLAAPTVAAMLPPPPGARQ
jgi:uncharacterized protein HemX